MGGGSADKSTTLHKVDLGVGRGGQSLQNAVGGSSCLNASATPKLQVDSTHPPAHRRGAFERTRDRVFARKAPAPPQCTPKVPTPERGSHNYLHKRTDCMSPGCVRLCYGIDRDTWKVALDGRKDDFAVRPFSGNPMLGSKMQVRKACK